jgi:hypothetical protein
MIMGLIGGKPLYILANEIKWMRFEMLSTD